MGHLFGYKMIGKYVPFNDGYGIVGYGYECPRCDFVTQFTTSEEGCSECGFSEEYKDPDDWYDEEIEAKLNPKWKWWKFWTKKYISNFGDI